MKKTIAMSLLIALLFALPADAGIRLRGKSIYDVHKNISFVNRDEVEHVFDEKLKVSAISPVTGISFSGSLGVKPSSPECNVYYFRVSGIGHADNVYGVKGLTLKFENLSDNVLVVHWNESAIQLGSVSGLPFINGMKYISAGKPSETPNTIIPPKASVNVDVYPSTTVKYDSLHGWHNLIEPISTSGTTHAILTMKIEDNGSSKYYSYKSPCMNFPDSFIKQYKYEKSSK